MDAEFERLAANYWYSNTSNTPAQKFQESHNKCLTALWQYVESRTHMAYEYGKADGRTFQHDKERPELPSKPEAISLEGVVHDCGGVFHVTRKIMPVHIYHKSILTLQEFYQCSVCGEKMFDLWQIDAARAAAMMAMVDETFDEMDGYSDDTEK